MSEEKRKSARLQGRFSDEIRPKRKEKQKRSSDQRHEDGSSNSSSVKVKTALPKPFVSEDGLDIQYDENAKASSDPVKFEEKKKPVEIKALGEHILSSTENGLSRVIFEPDFIPKDEAAELFTILFSGTKWYDKNIIIHGKEVPQPRLVAWYGPFPYAYSGAVLEAAEMTPQIMDIKERVERYLKAYRMDVCLNSVLLNLYRNEKDSVAWHSDDELSMGISPTIASVSLGEVRKFQMKSKPHVRNSDKSLVSEEYFVHLTSGSLVVMDGCMQDDWKHQVPKEYHDKAARINLTFRTVYPNDKLPAQVPIKPLENTNHHLAHPKTEISKPIFDSTNFPPLGVSLSSHKNEPENSCSASSKSKATPTTGYYTSSTDQDLPDMSNLPADNAEVTSHTNTDETSDICQDETPCQYSTATSTLGSDLNDSENLYVATEAVASGAGDEEDNTSEPTSVNNVNYEQNLSQDMYHSQEHEGSVTASGVEQQSRRYQLNAEASEFIPKFHDITSEVIDFDKVSMTMLADWFENGEISYPQYGDFSTALNRKITANYDFFSDRDSFELSVLCDINDDSQTEKNRTIILARLCSMIQNALKYKSRKITSGHYGSQSNRIGYRDNNRGFRSYRGTSYKSKGYKD